MTEKSPLSKYTSKYGVKMITFNAFLDLIPVKTLEKGTILHHFNTLTNTSILSESEDESTYERTSVLLKSGELEKVALQSLLSQAEINPILNEKLQEVIEIAAIKNIE